MKTKEEYLIKSREYKKKNKEKIKEQRKEYDKQYYINLSEEQKEKRREYNRQYRLKQKSLKPIKEPKPIPIKEFKKPYSEIFIEKATKLHNNKYNYSECNIINSKIKVDIICPIHGVFEQRPNDHLKGYGCGKCGGTKKLSNKEFIDKANTIHNSKYDYSKCEYINAKSNISIICPIHGIFEQKANNHLNGKGCKECGLQYGVWSYSLWEQKGLNSNNFDSFKLYIIECWNENEKFYKIGKTFKPINSRFKSNKLMPYNYKIVKLIEGTAEYISKLEIDLKNKNKEHSYLPNKSFNGRYECFNDISQIYEHCLL
jgi:hypothetical protein